MNYPIVFAHRGANSFAPENSLPAFEKAIELSCDGIELDVRPTTCGHVAVFHDRNTFRMTGVRNHIQRLGLSHIKELRLKDLVDSELKIPLLEEVLDLAGKNILINIDIKKESLVKNGFEEKIIKILNDFGLQENIIISSFNPFVLKKIAYLNPRLHMGFIFRNRSSMMMLNGQPVRSLHARYRILSNRYINNLYQRSGKIYAWTVDEEEAMIDLIQRGVDGIITNRPETFLKLKNDSVHKNETSTELVFNSPH